MCKIERLKTILEYVLRDKKDCENRKNETRSETFKKYLEGRIDAFKYLLELLDTNFEGIIEEYEEDILRESSKGIWKR